jgi:Tfp pilus assembly protein PilO
LGIGVEGKDLHPLQSFSLILNFDVRAIAYYLTHRQEIDNYLEQRCKKAQQQRNQFVQQYNLANLRQRLRDRFSNVEEAIAVSSKERSHS